MSSYTKFPSTTVTGGVRIGNDTTSATAANVGTLKYVETSGKSEVLMCMRTGASTYAWISIKANTW